MAGSWVVVDLEVDMVESSERVVVAAVESSERVVQVVSCRWF